MPIQGATKVEPRTIQRFIEGNHGNSILLSAEDVFLKHDADMDGDVVYVERPDNDAGRELIDAMDKLSQTPMWNSRDRLVHLGVYKRNPKLFSITNRKDRGEFYASNANAMFSEGKTVNAKTVANVMAYKNFSFIDNANDGVRIHVRKPTEKVVQDFIELDPIALMANGGELYDLIVDRNGDEVVIWRDSIKDWVPVEKDKLFAAAGLTKSGVKSKAKGIKARPLHMRTTFEHSLSTVLQMSVDNTSEKVGGLVGEIGLDENFLMNQIFYREDGEKIKTPGFIMKRIYNLFKYSATRRGKNVRQGTMTMAEMFSNFSEMRLRYFNTNGKLKSQTEIVKNISQEMEESFIKPNGKRIKSDWAWSNIEIIPDRITPMEQLLVEPDLYLERPELNEINDEIGPTVLEWLEGSYDYAHAETIDDINKSTKKFFKTVEKGSKEEVEIGQALDLLSAMADEFDAIFEKQKDNEGSELASGVSYDFNEDFIKFTEKWFPAYDGMTKQQKEFFTYKFLSGTKHINQRGNKTKKFQTRKLLPFKFLDKDIMRTYAKKFWQYLKVPYSQKRDYQSSKGMKKWGWNRFTDAFRVGRKENNIPRLCG